MTKERKCLHRRKLLDRQLTHCCRNFALKFQLAKNYFDVSCVVVVVFVLVVVTCSKPVTRFVPNGTSTREPTRTSPRSSAGTAYVKLP